MSQLRVDFAEQIEVEKFRPKGKGELEATFIHKNGHEEEFDLGYVIFDRHVLVWVVGYFPPDPAFKLPNPVSVRP